MILKVELLESSKKKSNSSAKSNKQSLGMSQTMILESISEVDHDNPETDSISKL